MDEARHRNNQEADLVVVGSRGHGGFSGAAPRLVAEREWQRAGGLFTVIHGRRRYWTRPRKLIRSPRTASGCVRLGGFRLRAVTCRRCPSRCSRELRLQALKGREDGQTNFTAAQLWCDAACGCFELPCSASSLMRSLDHARVPSHRADPHGLRLARGHLNRRLPGGLHSRADARPAALPGPRPGTRRSA